MAEEGAGAAVGRRSSLKAMLCLKPLYAIDVTAVIFQGNILLDTRYYIYVSAYLHFVNEWNCAHLSSQIHLELGVSVKSHLSIFKN